MTGRPTETQPRPCRNCPSAHCPPDPEAEDQLAFLRAGTLTREQVVFTCGWNPSRLCRGVADLADQALSREPSP